MGVNRIDISRLLTMVDEENEFVVCAQIAAMDHGAGWSYFACNRCTKPVHAINGSFRCAICNDVSVDPVMRYKLHARVIDETGKATFVIFNKQAEELVGHAASRFADQTRVENDYFPEEITNLAGKAFMFTVKVTAYNLRYGCDDYAVTNISKVYASLPSEGVASKARQPPTALQVGEEAGLVGKAVVSHEVLPPSYGVPLGKRLIVGPGPAKVKKLKTAQ